MPGTMPRTFQECMRGATPVISREQRYRSRAARTRRRRRSLLFSASSGAVTGGVKSRETGRRSALLGTIDGAGMCL